MLLHRYYRVHSKRKLTQNWKPCHHLHVSLQTDFFCPYIKIQCSQVLFSSPMTFIAWTENVKTIFCCVLQKIIQNDMIFGWTIPLRACLHLLPNMGQILLLYIIWPVLTFKTRLPRNNTLKYNKQIIILQINYLACTTENIRKYLNLKKQHDNRQNDIIEHLSGLRATVLLNWHLVLNIR